MMPDSVYLLALTLIKGVGHVTGRSLLQYFDAPELVFTASKQRLEKVPGIASQLARYIIEGREDALKRAERELLFVEKNNIRLYTFFDNDYPYRLRECADSPLTFFYKGTANLNASQIVSVVGTRKATEYGKEQVDALLRGLATQLPDLLVVSGLAYGIDVQAHLQALKYRLPTVGVMAHGLDRIYPIAHRNIAAQMLANGGLLTDFMSETEPERENFLRRNRLIAGLADATIVVESAQRGGALVTADIAVSYGREVLTFPGRVTDQFSQGCNQLIRENKAALIRSASDVMQELNWDIPSPKAIPHQTRLLFKESIDHPVLQLLAEKDELHVNDLATLLHLPIHKLMPLLFELEINEQLKSLPGNIYKLIR